MKTAGCRICVSEGNMTEYKVEELVTVGNLYLCPRHMKEAVTA